LAAGIVRHPHASEPGLRRGQLVFRNPRGEWIPFDSKYRFGQLCVDPHGVGRVFALVEDTKHGNWIAELRPRSGRNAFLGPSDRRNLAEAVDVDIERMLPATHSKVTEPRCFAMNGNGDCYYSDTKNKPAGFAASETSPPGMSAA